MKKFINYAHRGAPSYCPENTLMSFYTGVYMGANGIETDVQVTKDGVLVLFHDDALDRVTGEKGAIIDYTYSELQNFWVYNGKLKDKIITLEEFFVKFKDFDLTFAIELKAKNVHKQTADLINKYNLIKKVIVTSFDYESIKNIKEYSPNLRIGYLTSLVDSEVIDKLKAINAYEICPESKIITLENVNKWKSLGFNVRAWGVYDEEIMKSVYKAGVDGMTVNFPDKLTQYIKSKLDRCKI